MARGRLISTSISIDEGMADLAIEAGLSGALFLTWLIAHLDVDGKQTGSPRKLKALVAPMIDEITPETITKTLNVAEKLGIVKQYTHEGRPVVWFQNFRKHQPGIRRDKEAKSQYGDAPENINKNNGPGNSGLTPDLGRTNSVLAPELPGTNINEMKRNEIKRNNTKTEIEKKSNQEKINEHEPPKETQSWKEGQSITRGTELLGAVAAWGWCVNLKQSHLKDFNKIAKLGEISHSEIVEARDKTNSKNPEDKTAYFLGIIARKRSELAVTIPDETAPPAPKIAAWKEYKHLENQEEKENGLAGSSA